MPHTLGPWRVQPGGTSWSGADPPVIRASGNVGIATVRCDEQMHNPATGDRDEAAESARDHANAVLMALAPEMFAICKLAKGYLLPLSPPFSQTRDAAALSDRIAAVVTAVETM